MNAWRFIAFVLITIGPSSNELLPAQDFSSKSPSVALYGCDTSPGAPLAAWYRRVGITDVWMYPVRGAFPEDQNPDTQFDIARLQRTGVIEAYRNAGIHYWWFERPVPDYFYYLNENTAGLGGDGIWSATSVADTLWSGIVDRIDSIYPEVRSNGFAGIVFDTEAYYSYRVSSDVWLWGGHPDQLGSSGNYYIRGRQIGEAITSVWPHARVIVVYSFGYPGEYWWYKGLQDAGVDLYLGIEHTYGAGPEKPGDLWYQHWWRPGGIPQIVREKRSFFSFLPDDLHVLAGIFPVDFGKERANYAFRFFQEQLAEARDEPTGPISVWIWPQGSFTPDSWKQARLLENDTYSEYWEALSRFSGTPTIR